MPEAFLAACALVLVLEGLLPLIAPRVWRDAFRRLTRLVRRAASLYRAHIDWRRRQLP